MEEGRSPIPVGSSGRLTDSCLIAMGDSVMRDDKQDSEKPCGPVTS